MSEIRDRDEFVLTVNRLMICAMEDIDCGRNEAGPTTLDLVQRLEDHDAALRAENARLAAACRMVLLFYNAGYWTEANADEWANVTGETDATTRVLCDTVRRALGPPALSAAREAEARADAGKEG